MKYINGNSARGRDCRFYRPIAAEKNDSQRTYDGICLNEKHKKNHIGEKCCGWAMACFDADVDQLTIKEDPDGS